LLFAASAGAADLTPDCGAVPGWTQKRNARVYVPDDLFDYMDGNAEGYIIYGFEKMTGVSCTSGGNTIHIDYFLMGSPTLAWGVFTSNRHPRYGVETIGMIGQVMPRRAAFVKGRYYVELAANQDQRDALEAYAKALEPTVPGTTKLPAELKWFPREGLDTASLRLVPQSVLGLRMLKRGFVAKYADVRVFLVEEESPEAAAGVLAKLKERLSGAAPAGIGDEGITGKDRYLGQMCVARKGAYLIGAVSRAEGAALEARTKTLAARLP